MAEQDPLRQRCAPPSSEVGETRKETLSIEDIAQMSRVSKATVSRVLNGTARVSEDVRRRVMEVMATTDYAPRQRMVPGNIIGFTLDYHDALKSLYINRILQGAQRKAYDEGYDLMLLHNHRLRQHTGHLPFYLRQKMLAGIIVLLSKMNDQFVHELSRVQFPHMIMGDRPSESLAYIDADNFTGSREAIRHLVALGHRHIALMIPVDAAYFDYSERLRGYQAGLEEAGLPFERTLLFLHEEVGGTGDMYNYAAMDVVLRRRPDVTAVLTNGDETVMVYLDEHGLRAPADLSLIAFCDSVNGSGHFPSLTAVAQDCFEMGRLAVEDIIRQITNPDSRTAPAHIIMPSRLLPRSTTAPPRAYKNLHLPGKNGAGRA